MRWLGPVNYDRYSECFAPGLSILRVAHNGAFRLCCPAIKIKFSPKNPNLMSPEEEVERVKALCTQVVNEKDPAKFSALLEELDMLLKSADDRLNRRQTA